MSEINLVTVALLGIFLLPVLAGALEDFSRERIQLSLGSLLDNVEFLLGLLLSVYLTKKVFFENSEGIFQQIYAHIPENIKSVLYGKDILTYAVAVPVILLVMLLVLRGLTMPVYRHVVLPLADRIYEGMYSVGGGLRRIMGALWQVPKAVYIVFICGLLLNFYVYYFPAPILTKWMNESGVYQVLYKNALYPVLNSNIAKKIPVLVNDSFRRNTETTVPDGENPDNASIAERIARGLSGRNVRIIEYFNGVTLDEAIKSSPEIDETARKIVGKEEDSKKKAYLLYRWVSRNLRYDDEKAVQVSKDPMGVSSGSVVAFNTRKGICFDFSCLYISMCRAVGVKVRMVTGLGYSGISWGDHAWNQVYASGEQRWVDVDTTFGTVGNYFDKPDFGVDHKYAEVQGEW